MILTPPGSSPPPTLFRSPSVSAALTLLNEFIETRDRILRATEVAPLADDQLLHIPNIAASDFDTLRKLFEQDQTFRYGRLRLNYSSASRELIVYMPSTAHEFFVTEMSEMLGSALKNVLSDSHSTRSTRKAMKRMGLSFYRSSELLLAKGYIEPDEQIGSREEEEQLPMLVLEVAVSQSWDALRRKLVRIVVETEGEVKFALGFKLEAGRGVRVVAYQPEETEVEREGSDSDGSSDSGSGSDAGTVVFGERCVLDDVVVRPDGSVRQGTLHHSNEAHPITQRQMNRH